MQGLCRDVQVPPPLLCFYLDHSGSTCPAVTPSCARDLGQRPLFIAIERMRQVSPDGGCPRTLTWWGAHPASLASTRQDSQGRPPNKWNLGAEPRGWLFQADWMERHSRRREQLMQRHGGTPRSGNAQLPKAPALLLRLHQEAVSFIKHSLGSVKQGTTLQITSKHGNWHRWQAPRAGAHGGAGRSSKLPFFLQRRHLPWECSVLCNVSKACFAQDPTCVLQPFAEKRKRVVTQLQVGLPSGTCP